jgi:hypothetical protein
MALSSSDSVAARGNAVVATEATRGLLGCVSSGRKKWPLAQDSAAASAKQQSADAPLGCCYRPDPSASGVGSARLLLSSRCLGSRDRNGDAAIARATSTARSLCHGRDHRLRALADGSLGDDWLTHPEAVTLC